MSDEILTVEEVAAITRLSPSTLYDWRSQKPPIGPRSFTFGRRVVYRRADLDAWIAAQEQQTGRGGAS